MEAKEKGQRKSCNKKREKRNNSTASTLAISQRVESRFIAVMVNHLKKTKAPAICTSSTSILSFKHTPTKKNPLHSTWKTLFHPLIYWNYSESIFKLGGSWLFQHPGRKVPLSSTCVFCCLKYPQGEEESWTACISLLESGMPVKKRDVSKEANL